MKKVYPHTRLKALRVEYGFTQDDMARKLSISVGAYSMKEKGITSFTQSEIQIILDLFNLSYEEIFLQQKPTGWRLTSVRANGSA